MIENLLAEFLSIFIIGIILTVIYNIFVFFKKRFDIKTENISRFFKKYGQIVVFIFIVLGFLIAFITQ